MSDAKVYSIYRHKMQAALSQVCEEAARADYEIMVHAVAVEAAYEFVVVRRARNFTCITAIAVRAPPRPLDRELLNFLFGGQP